MKRLIQWINAATAPEKDIFVPEADLGTGKPLHVSINSAETAYVLG